MKKVLIVDADTVSANLARAILADAYQAHTVASCQDCLGLISQDPYDVVLLDISHDAVGSAIDSLAKIAKAAPCAAVVCCSGDADPGLIAEVVKAGASSFAAKPYAAERLKRAVRIALLDRVRRGDAAQVRSPAAAYRAAVAETEDADDESDDEDEDDETPYTGSLLGDSRAIKQVRSRIRLFAQNDAPVLILGESGTGKELAAVEVHALSSRRAKRFVPLDCASIPETLAESELFGTSRGAFTGAVDRKGVFEEADGGTVFLDEVGELTLPVQAKLLRALESRSGSRVGSLRQAPFDVRLISATNSPVFGDPCRFRPELLNRLNTLVLHMPPLRVHAEDIPILAKAFLAAFAPAKVLSDEALEKLQKWHWPGNGRELKNTVHRAAVLSGKRSKIGSVHVETQADAPWGNLQYQLI